MYLPEGVRITFLHCTPALSNGMEVLTILLASSLVTTSNLPSTWYFPSCPFSGSPRDPSESIMFVTELSVLQSRQVPSLDEESHGFANGDQKSYKFPLTYSIMGKRKNHMALPAGTKTCKNTQGNRQRFFSKSMTKTTDSEVPSFLLLSRAVVLCERREILNLFKFGLPCYLHIVLPTFRYFLSVISHLFSFLHYRHTKFTLNAVEGTVA